MEAQSQEFVRRVDKYARDVHEWEGSRCDFHTLCVLMCRKCNEENVKCAGKPYKTRFVLCCTKLNVWRGLHRSANWFTPSSKGVTPMELKPLIMY